jgi:hypothetical protein
MNSCPNGITPLNHSYRLFHPLSLAGCEPLFFLVHAYPHYIYSPKTCVSSNSGCSLLGITKHQFQDLLAQAEMQDKKLQAEI